MPSVLMCTMRRTVVVVIAARMLLGAPLSGQSSIVDEYTSVAVGVRRDSTHREASGPIVPEPLLRARRDEPLPPLPRAPESKWECLAVTAQTTVGGAAMGGLIGALFSPLFSLVAGGEKGAARRLIIISASTGAMLGFVHGAQSYACRTPLSPRDARLTPRVNTLRLAVDQYP